MQRCTYLSFLIVFKLKDALNLKEKTKDTTVYIGKESVMVLYTDQEVGV